MKFFFFIAILYTTAFGLSNPESYMLTPVTGDKSHYANSLSYFEDESAKIVMNFNNTTGDFFEFFAVIENKNDSNVTFEPIEIYAEAYPDEHNLEAEPEIIYSADPVEQLELINKDLAELKKQKTISDGLNCFFAGISIVAANVSHTSDDAGTSDSILDDILAEEDEYAYNKYDLESEKLFWENQVLWSSVVQPGKKAAGSFFIPVSPTAKWIKVIIPFGDSEYIFNFRQSKVWIN